MRVDDLDDELARMVAELEARASMEGIKIERTSGLRGFEHQSELYAAYRRRAATQSLPAAPPGLSRHHGWGRGGKSLATDVRVVGVSGPTKDAQQRRVGELGEGLGLVWGGRFDPADPVHFELGFELGGFDIWKANRALMKFLDENWKGGGPA